MPDSSKLASRLRGLRPGLLLAADGVLFVSLAFKTVELMLLGLDGVIDPLPAFGGATLCALAVPGLFALERRLAWLDSRERWWDQVVGLALPVALIFLLYSAPAKKGRSSAWIPIEWHKLPLNVEFMAGLQPMAGALIGAGFVLLALSMASERPRVRRLGQAWLVWWALMNTFSTARLPISHKSSTYLVCFVAPQVFALAFAVGGFKRWASRAAFAALCGSLLFWHYDGWLPAKDVPFQDHPPGFTRVYPTEDLADFPLTYMRDLSISRDRRYLYTCFGPSSGIVRVDLERPHAVVIGVPGLSRYLWPRIVDDVLLTMDWDKGDFFVFSADPFERLRRIDLLEEGRIAPWSFTVARDRVYITFHERPILAEFSWPEMELLRTLDMKEAGYTRFNAGLLELVYDEHQDALYAELGMIDASDTFLILKIDRERFEVTATAELPEGGLELITLPPREADPRGSVLLASFFSDQIYEMHADDLSLKRVFDGPTNSRNIEYDASRDALIGLAFLPGELWAIDYPTGEPFRRRNIGRKAQSLLLDAERDELYFGSDQGLYRVELTSWLGPPGPDPGRLERATVEGVRETARR